MGEDGKTRTHVFLRPCTGGDLGTQERLEAAWGRGWIEDVIYLPACPARADSINGVVRENVESVAFVSTPAWMRRWTASELP